MKFDEVIEKRHSVREFSSKNVKWADILEAIDAALKSPFAGNINHIKFLIVENEDSKRIIAQHCQQFWTSDAKFIVLACSDYSHLEDMYDLRGSIYGRQQAGAAIENFLLKITDMGLASCWVGAYADELIKQHLKIPQHIQIEAILPVGYKKASAKSKQKKKLSLENTIMWESWGQTKKPK